MNDCGCRACSTYGYLLIPKLHHAFLQLPRGCIIKGPSRSKIETVNLPNSRNALQIQHECPRHCILDVIKQGRATVSDQRCFYLTVLLYKSRGIKNVTTVHARGLTFIAHGLRPPLPGMPSTAPLGLTALDRIKPR